MLHVGNDVSVGSRCHSIGGRGIKPSHPHFCCCMIHMIGGLGLFHGVRRAAAQFVFISWIRCALHNCLEKIITFSLQLEIRHVNSRFEAHEHNFHNPSESLSDCGYICLHGDSSVSPIRISS